MLLLHHLIILSGHLGAYLMAHLAIKCLELRELVRSMLLLGLAFRMPPRRWQSFSLFLFDVLDYVGHVRS